MRNHGGFSGAWRKNRWQIRLLPPASIASRYMQQGRIGIKNGGIFAQSLILVQRQMQTLALRPNNILVYVFKEAQ